MSQHKPASAYFYSKLKTIPWTEAWEMLEQAKFMTAACLGISWVSNLTWTIMFCRSQWPQPLLFHLISFCTKTFGLCSILWQCLLQIKHAKGFFLYICCLIILLGMHWFWQYCKRVIQDFLSIFTILCLYIPYQWILFQMEMSWSL